MQRKPIINAHCHLLNFEFIPKEMVKLMAVLPKDVLNSSTGNIISHLLSFIPGKQLGKLEYFVETYKKSINKVANDYIAKVNEAQVDIFVPLMMDLFEAAKAKNIDERNLIDYEKQIELISLISANNPFQVFPFVMFDPRRSNSYELCEKAVLKHGFTGIKMYPALGYNPNPDLNINTEIRDRLNKIYDFCKNCKIPITTHASIGGAYDVNFKDSDAWLYTEISNWTAPVLKYNLKINFAHFGGNYLESLSKLDSNGFEDKKEQSEKWREAILKLIEETNPNKQAQIYTDLAYHDIALANYDFIWHKKPKVAKKYFADLKELLNDDRYKDFIMFGTDASMISHTWTEKEYIKAYKDNLAAEQQDIIFTQNPINFLFEQGKIPENYINFLKTKYGENLPLKPWVEQKDNGYFIYNR